MTYDPFDPRTTPTAALRNAARRLNPFSLRHLLATSSLLSWEAISGPEMLSVEGGAFHPMLHSMNLQHFTLAVLTSNSRHYKTRPVGRLDVEDTLRLLEPVMNGKDELLETIPDMSFEELMHSVVAVLYRTQAELDGRHFLWRLARLQELLVNIPRRHASTVQAWPGVNGVDLPAAFQGAFGVSIPQVMVGLLMVAHRHMRFTYDQFSPPPLQRGDSSHIPSRQVALQNHLARQLPRVHQLEMPESALRGILAFLSDGEFEQWVEWCTGSIEQVRDLLNHDLYRKGTVTYRPLPLERIPLVQLPTRPGQERHFVAPNSHSFLKAIYKLPDLLINMHWERVDVRRYQSLRGTVQEIYLQELVSTQLPTYPVIPETRYPSPEVGTEVRSADLTILDPHSQGLILVESKARRFGPLEWAQEGIDQFRAFDKLMTETINAAPWKARDLFTEPAFQEWASELQTLDPARVLSVVVYGESMPMLSVLWRNHIASTSHDLKKTGVKFLALSLEEFELMVDTAASENRSLYGLLLDLQTRFDAGTGLSGDLFMNVDLPEQRYLSSTLDGLLEEFEEAIKVQERQQE